MSKRGKKYKQLPMPRNTKFNESLRGNIDTYYMWFYRMCEIYMNRFSFKNMPDTIDIPTLMYGLLFSGNVGFFKDEIMGYLCLMGVPSRQVDVYNYQVAYYIHTASGYNRHLRVSRFDPLRDGVVIYANQMRQADIAVVDMYARRLAEALRTCDVNIANQKTMKIIGTSDEQRLTLENILKDYSGNVPICLVDKALDMGGDNHPVYDMTAPYVADKIWVYITNIWNDFLTWLGVENATNQKRERMVTDEVNANYGDVEQERKKGLQCIKTALKEINELFGLNIELEFNSDLPSGLNMPELTIGGIKSGDVYSEDQRVGEVSGDRDTGGTPGSAFDVQ